MRVVELFAGVGGFRIGLEGASPDYEVVWSNQWEPSTKSQPASECYQVNFGEDACHINSNISLVDKANIPDHDLLVGGFPCQDYSVARSGADGIVGKKGVLFWDIAKTIEEKQPKYVLLENVDRLLKSPTKQRGRDFAVMLATFRDLGYMVEWRMINAAEYGHVQRRRRVFIFAAREDSDFFESNQDKLKRKILREEGFFAPQFPVHLIEHPRHGPTAGELKDDILEISETSKHTFRNAGVMIGGSFYSEELTPVEEEPLTLRDILETNVSEKYYLNEDRITRSGRTELEQFEYLKGSKRIERVNKEGHTYIYSEGAMDFPDSLDKPARTMLTSEASINRSTHIIEDPETGRLRKLTPLECERINEFPDNWTSHLTDRQRYFTMGNALVVGLIKKMAERLLRIENGGQI